jgi:hypothetical protein
MKILGLSTSKAGSYTSKLWSLIEMERTGGELDVVGHDKKTGEYIFCDGSAESPKGRRSACYDREALESRKNINQKTTLLIWQLPWVLAFKGRTISRVAETWKFRCENVELGESTF